MNVTGLEPTLFFRPDLAATDQQDLAQLTRDLRSRNPQVVEVAGAAINKFADNPQTWLRRFVLQHRRLFGEYRPPMRAIFSVSRFVTMARGAETARWEMDITGAENVPSVCEFVDRVQFSLYQSRPNFSAPRLSAASLRRLRGCWTR